MRLPIRGLAAALIALPVVFASASSAWAQAGNANQGARNAQQQGQGQAEDSEIPLLSDEQINVIKVFEMPQDLRPMNSRIRVPREVIQEVLERYTADSRVPRGAAERRDFLRQGGAAHLELLYSLATAHPEVRQYYRRINIQGDPDTIAEFRRTVYGNYIERYFRRNFGEGQVEGLRLVPPGGDPNVEMYTNLYLLSKTEIENHPMIDRDLPADSLLLQWGLPRQAAKYPAPDVRGWRPFFTGLDDPNLQRMAAWIDSLYDGTRDYGINRPEGRERREEKPANGNANQR